MNIVELYQWTDVSHISIPYFSDGIKAGFPSPASEFPDKHLDLNEYLIQHPASTFFVKVIGDSMTGSNIHEGDILIVDRSLIPKNDDVIVAYLRGEFTVKKFLKEDPYVYLVPTNPAYKRIQIQADEDFVVWGVVTYVISKLKF
jgi:DNA polymerase V